LAKRTGRPEVLGQIGGFASGFALDLAKYPNPVLVSGTDGVGTKLKIAFAAGRHDTIGIDCVAMCVNDILTVGAEPLYFLDYLATGHLEVDVAEAVVAGIAAGCLEAGAALVGGETAEMPGMYAAGEYDVAGFAVGVVNRDQMITGDETQDGDAVLGLASSGIHSNGYSLVRKLVDDAGLRLDQTFPGESATVADVLLRPTRIYVKPIQSLLALRLPVRAMAHITGGGIVENVPRVLPEGLGLELARSAWELPNVFQWLLRQSGMAFEEAARVWNLGVGFVIITTEAAANDVAEHLAASGETVYRLGRVRQGTSGVRWV
jgi:phosphoribosylformylglycinamidine cyclo-ligase